MANVDIKTVVQDLNRRFAEPLPEFYNRRIIFWYDEDKEFEDKVDDVVLSNATLVKMTGTNNFAVKKLLCHDDKSGNYVVYSPISYAKPDDNWLIGMEQYSEEYRSDLNSIWMSEMGLPASAAIRKLIKEYRKFFNSKERRGKVAQLNNGMTSAKEVVLASMAVICGIKDIQPNSIMMVSCRLLICRYSSKSILMDSTQLRQSRSGRNTRKNIIRWTPTTDCIMVPSQRV
jgi:hypothetical protein